MTSTQPSETSIEVPEIHVQSASPRQQEKSPEEETAPPSKPTSDNKVPPAQTLSVPRRSTRKRTATEASIASSDSGRESKMGKKESEHSSKKHHSGSSKSKSKSQKTDDWAEVTDPEERRRIQNRIAQRKFREKTKEQRERAERESRNQEHAGSSYRVPEPEDIDAEQDMTGPPWGTFSMRQVIARGHEHESRRSSGRDEYLREDAHGYLAQPNPYADNYGYSAGAHQHQAASYGGSSDDPYYDEQNAYYPEYDSAGNPVQPHHYHQQAGGFLTDQFQLLGRWPDSPGLGSSSLPYDTQELYY